MRRVALVISLTVMTAACASSRAPRVPTTLRVEVLPALDRVPVTAPDAFLPPGPEGGESARRGATMLALAADLASTLDNEGARVCLGAPLPDDGTRPDSGRLAAIGRADGADAVVSTELIAYGQVRRSWLWLLAAQGLVAGIGHGVVVARATGNPTTGWWVGAGEFALETVTWVGGALVASRVMDPVIVRVRAVRTSDGAEIGHWTREGTRPPSAWLRRVGLPPRNERLQGVAERVFSKLGPKIAARLERDATSAATARR